MKILGVLLVLGLLCGLAEAARPRLLLSFGLCPGFPTGDFAGSSILRHQGGAQNAGGLQAALGLSTERCDVYAGYRQAVHIAETSERPLPGMELNTFGEWTLARWVLGGRARLVSPVRSAVSPVVGGGLSFGRTRGKGSTTSQQIPYSLDETSASATGYFLEGGLSTRLGNNFDLVGALQYHAFRAEFSEQLIQVSDGYHLYTERFTPAVDVTFLSLLLALNYRF